MPDTDLSPPGESLSAYDAAALARLLSLSFRLIRNDCTEIEWLQQLATLTGADHAACLRWLPGQQDSRVVVGTDTETPHIPEAWHEELEQLLDQQRLPAAVLLEDLATLESLAGPMPGQHCMAALIDVKPTLMLLLLHRYDDSPAWGATERARFRALLPVLRESVQLHKYTDTFRQTSAIAGAMLNTSPDGLLLLQPDGSLLYRNQAASALLDRADAIALESSRLRILDRTVQREVMAILAAMNSLPVAQLPDLQQHWSLQRAGTGPDCQLSLQIICIPEWNIESRDSDRVALLSVRDLQSLRRPSEQQLRSYFGLTTAQARLALALYGGAGIAEAAAELGITVNTARSHLRNIYARTGARSHADLMSRLSATMTNHPAEMQPDSRLRGLKN